MQLYTIQMAQWRKAKEKGIEFLDITVKSGDKRLAPTWELLQPYKRGEITDEQYTEVFIQLMRRSYQDHTAFWLELCHKSSLAIACYCAPNTFCHRHLLKDMFQKVCAHHHIPFEYVGEIS